MLPPSRPRRTTHDHAPLVRAPPLRRPVHGCRGLGRAGLLWRGRIGAAGDGDAVITDFLIAAVIIGGFLAIAELAWLPIRRRAARPTPDDSTERLAAEAGTCGLSCVVLAVLAVVALAAMAGLNLALEATH